MCVGVSVSRCGCECGYSSPSCDDTSFCALVSSIVYENVSV